MCSLIPMWLLSLLDRFSLHSQHKRTCQLMFTGRVQQEGLVPYKLFCFDSDTNGVCQQQPSAHRQHVSIGSWRSLMHFLREAWPTSAHLHLKLQAQEGQRSVWTRLIRVCLNPETSLASSWKTLSKRAKHGTCKTSNKIFLWKVNQFVRLQLMIRISSLIFCCLFYV